ncbi:MAG: DUF512 domain-containing protein [Bacillota bacterium]|nr:DUF512 domain-containing protein [Bacillota bacterium]
MEKTDFYPYLLSAVSRDNVLPLTSRCNLSCVFCSHRQNPPDIATFAVPPLPRETAMEAAQFLDPDKKVVIGESATRLNEGEPFTHPDIIPILQNLRRMLPATPLSVTTNGTLLTRDLVSELAALQPLEITVSLNSATEAGRRLVLKDPEPKRAIAAISYLQQQRIPFHGSLVAMPHLTGWHDMTETTGFLADAGAQTVRVFLPGYTRLAVDKLRFPLSLWTAVTAWAKERTADLGMPVISEPALCNNTTPEVCGIIRETPAAKAGMQPGDIICTVDGKTPRSRVDAFERARRAANPVLDVMRAGRKLSFSLNKKSREAPGFVVHYDFPAGRMDQLAAEIHQVQPDRTLLLASEFGHPLLQIVTAAMQLLNVSVQAVPSLFFGGSIKSAGLLTVRDFLAAATQAAQSGPYKLILLPREAFDHRGLDLLGVSPDSLARHLSVPVHIV